MNAFNQGNKICLTPDNGVNWIKTVEAETPGRAYSATQGESISVPDLNLQGQSMELNA